MSWDVILMNVLPDKTISYDFSDDLSDLGPRSQVLSTLAALFPNIDFTDPMWGFLESDGYSIQFNIGDRDPVEMITLHIHGSDSVIGVIKQICEHTRWRAFDTTTGDFIDFEKQPAAGLTQWRTYRDKVVDSLIAEGKEVIVDAKVVQMKDNVNRLTNAKNKKWWRFWED
jgi:hypothetical protein